MAVFKSRLEWMKNKGKVDPQEITNWKAINIRSVIDLKSNQMTISLPNDFGANGPREFNNSSGSIVGTGAFQINDKFKIYAKYDTDNSGLDLSENSVDLIFFGDLKEVKSKAKDKSDIHLICTDRTFNILNRIGWATYSDNDTNSPNKIGWTAPLMIRDIIQQRAGTNTAGKSKAELIYDKDGHITPSSTEDTEFLVIDARLVSESTPNNPGFIQDDRSVTIDKDGISISRTIGTADSNNSLFPAVPTSTRNHNFPLKKYTAAGKPVYEMLQNVSQVDMTNTANELDATNATFNVIIQRAMRYYLDEHMRFHWFYPIDNTFADSSTTTATDSKDKNGNTLDLVMGNTNIYEIKSHEMDYVLFEVINFIYYEAGIDMNGDSILGFRYDPTSGAPNLKDTKRSYPTIPQDMMLQDDATDNSAGHILPDTTKKSGYAFPTTYGGSGITPLWSSDGTVVQSNGEYNIQFKLEARRRANAKADSIIRGTSSQRWKGKIETRFYNFTVTDLLRYTSEAGGIYRTKLRIQEVQHNFTKVGGFTTLTVEEDGKELKA